MTLEKLELSKFSEVQKILVFMKLMGLIKERPRYYSFNEQVGGIYYD